MPAGSITNGSVIGNDRVGWNTQTLNTNIPFPSATDGAIASWDGTTKIRVWQAGYRIAGVSNANRHAILTITGGGGISNLSSARVQLPSDGGGTGNPAEVLFNLTDTNTTTTTSFNYEVKTYVSATGGLTDNLFNTADDTRVAMMGATINNDPDNNYWAKLYFYSVPNAPSLTASATNGGISATVTAPAVDGGRPISSYTIQYSTDSSFSTYSSVSATDGVAQTITVGGGTYYVRAYATNVVGDSPASVTRTVITSIVPDTPSISSTSSNATSVTFSWGVTTNASTYEVAITTGTTNPSYSSVSTNRTHTFTALSNGAALSPGTTYKVWVRAVSTTLTPGTAASTNITTLANPIWLSKTEAERTFTVKIGVPITGISLASFVDNESTIELAAGYTKPDWMQISSAGVISGTPTQRTAANFSIGNYLDRYTLRFTAIGQQGTTPATSPYDIIFNIVFPGRRFGAAGWTQLTVARRFDGTQWVPIQSVSRRTGTAQGNTTPPTTT